MSELNTGFNPYTGENQTGDISAEEFKKILRALGREPQTTAKTAVEPMIEPTIRPVTPVTEIKPSIQVESPIEESKFDDTLVSRIRSTQDVDKLKAEIEALELRKANLEQELAIARKTSDEINRLAIKEASQLLAKAKRNADMILRESMDYVSGLTQNIDDFKLEAINFRANVAKLSDDVLETIDSSDLFALIREENAMKEKD